MKGPIAAMKVSAFRSELTSGWQREERQTNHFGALYWPTYAIRRPFNHCGESVHVEIRSKGEAGRMKRERLSGTGDVRRSGGGQPASAETERLESCSMLA